MQPKEYSTNNEPHHYDNETSDQDLKRMNQAYMKDYESIRQSKINKWLYILVVVLCVIVGIQGYYLLEKPHERKSEENSTDLMMKDLFFQNNPLDSWDPFEDFQRMQKRMDRFFERGLPDLKSALPPMKSFSFGGPFSQNFDLKEKGDQLVISLELPGLDETNVNVTIEDQTLKISGTLEKMEENKQKNNIFQSWSSSHFERYLTLPNPVKPESLQINYNDDILIIKLDKSTSKDS